MAITFTLTSRTIDGLSYQLAQDDQAGGSVQIDTAQMRADLAAGQLGGDLFNLFNEYPKAPAPAGNEANRILLGADAVAPVGAVVDLENIAHCRAWFSQVITGTVINWVLSAVSPGGGEIAYQIAAPTGAASTILLYIAFRHTYVR